MAKTQEIGGKKTTVERVNEWRRESKLAWQDAMNEFKKDFQFRLGDQWPSDLVARLSPNQVPLALNILKKRVDTLSGSERQNRTDIKVLPIEGADQVEADVYTKLIKWVMDDRWSQHYVSEAFKDACTCGIGWIEVGMSFDYDPKNGDFIVRNESPFKIMPDPRFTRRDFDDCDYIMRGAWVDKDRLLAAYSKIPGASEKIKSSNPSPESEFTISPFRKPGTGSNNVNVVECFYKDYKDIEYVYDPGTNMMINVDEQGSAKDVVAFIQQTARNSGFETTPKVVKSKSVVYKMAVVLEESQLLYDDISPHKVNGFPFIPVFGYYDSSYDDWKYKVQGIIRSLRDIQLEKNKRRSQLMKSTLSMPQHLIVYDEGAVDDISDIKKMTQTGMLKKRKGKDVVLTPPPQIPVALVQLEQMFDGDISQIGMNDDMLGFNSDKGSSGVALKLRQRQSIAAVQEMFDNLSLAKKMVGKYLIGMINKHWDSYKMQRVLGKEYKLPPDFDKIKSSARFDCTVDEMASSPTARIANYMALSELNQNNQPVPTEIMIDLMPDIDPETKARYMQVVQQQNQGQQQAEQMRAQLEEKKMAMDFQVQMEKTKADIEIERLKIASDLIKAGMDPEQANIVAFNLGKEEQPLPPGPPNAQGVPQQGPQGMPPGMPPQGMPEGPPPGIEGMMPEQMPTGPGGPVQGQLEGMQSGGQNIPPELMQLLQSNSQ